MATLVKLTKNDAGDYDLEFEDGKVKMSTDGEAAAVAMTERILCFRTECNESPIVDTNANPLAGTDWYGIVFRSDASRVEKENEIKRVILSTPGVEAILNWSWEQVGRTINLDFQVKTAWGAMSVSEEITPL